MSELSTSAPSEADQIIHPNYPKGPPNYFVSIPIQNERVLQNCSLVQTTMLKNEKFSKPILIPISSMHVTLMVLRLDEDHCIHDAKKSMENVISTLGKMSFQSFQLNFAKIGHFQNEVLFADVVKDDAFEKMKQLCNIVSQCFEKNGISRLDAQRDFNPHLTLAKMSTSGGFKLKKFGIKKIKKDWYKEHDQIEFGTETVDRVQLLSMLKPKDPVTGYYHCVCEMKFA